MLGNRVLPFAAEGVHIQYKTTAHASCARLNRRAHSDAHPHVWLLQRLRIRLLFGQALSRLNQIWLNPGAAFRHSQLAKSSSSCSKPAQLARFQMRAGQNCASAGGSRTSWPSRRSWRLARSSASTPLRLSNRLVCISIAYCSSLVVILLCISSTCGRLRCCAFGTRTRLMPENRGISFQSLRSSLPTKFESTTNASFLSRRLFAWD